MPEWKKTAAMVLIAVTACAQAARADFIYTSQSRSVSGFTHGQSGDQTTTLSSSNFNPWDMTANQTESTGGFGKQHQNSSLLPNLISIKGDFSGNPPAFVGTGYATGSTTATIAFNLATTQDITLDVTASIGDTWAGVSGSQVGTRTVTLTGPNTNISVTGMSKFTPELFPGYVGWPGTTHVAATLGPGSYTLAMILNSKVGPNGLGGGQPNYWRVSSYDIELAAIPEPGTLALIALAAPLLMRRRRFA